MDMDFHRASKAISLGSAAKENIPPHKKRKIAVGVLLDQQQRTLKAGESDKRSKLGPQYAGITKSSPQKRALFALPAKPKRPEHTLYLQFAGQIP
jgi:hypothetical protein